MLAVLVTAGYIGWLDLHVRDQFEGRRWSIPARIYARPVELYPGMPMSADALETELRAAGYRRARAAKRAATYSRDGDRINLYTRRFQFWDGEQPAQSVQVRFKGARVSGLRGKEGKQALVRLDPALVGRIYPNHHEDRVLVRLEEVPRGLVAADGSNNRDRQGWRIQR